MKTIADKEERYRLAMAALFDIARYKKDRWEDDQDGYLALKNIARNTLKSFGKTKGID